MDECEVIRGFLFPPHEQASRAVGPAMRSLDDPPSLALAFVAGSRLAVTRRHMKTVSTTCDESFNRRATISFVQAEVLPAASWRTRTGHWDGVQSFGSQFLVMSVRAGDRDAQGHAPTIGEHRTLDAQFATIGRVFACLFPPRGAPWSSLRRCFANPTGCLSTRRTPGARPATAGEKPAV